MNAPHIWIATNHGAIGGGEVMLMQIAEALRELGRAVTVVAPSHPPALVDAARAKGLDVEVLDAHDRVSWMFALRRWDRRHREGILWCNGLVPATATAGQPNRIVHLHQYLSGRNRLVALIARSRAMATLVPSEAVAATVPGSVALPNWTAAFEKTARRRLPDGPFVVGYLGRLSADKGVHVLAEAIRILDGRAPGRFRLRIAGETRFAGRRSGQRVREALAGISALTDTLGWVSPQGLFDTVDVLVVPSVAPESFGLVAAEAMAAQVPVIVSDAGALVEVVGEDSGMAVPAGDAQALADRIERLAAGSDAAIGEQFARWEEQFSSDAGGRRLRAFLGEIPALRVGV